MEFFDCGKFFGFGGNAVGAEDNGGVFGNLFNGVGKLYASAAEFTDDEVIVDDFIEYV